MRKVIICTFCLIVLVTAIAFADLTIQYFTGKSTQDGILLEWKTGDEGGTSYFQIERSANNPNNFIYLNTVNATGNNSFYSYLDNSLMRLSGASIYYYRLKCVKPGGSYVYSNTITVVHSVSGIKDTWGSIKAIFR